MVETLQESLMISVGPDGKMSSDQLPWFKPSTASSSSWNMSPKLQTPSPVQHGGPTASELMYSKSLPGQNSSFNTSSDLLLAGVLPKWSNKSSVLERYPQATIQKASPSSGLSLLSNISFQPESYSNTSQLLQHLQLGLLTSATGNIRPGNYTNGSQAACLRSASASPMVLTSDPQLGCGIQPWDDPEGECQSNTLYVTLAPSEACCTRCVISARLPTIAYIPSPNTVTTAGNGYVISNDTRKSKQKSTQHAQTASNSVYVLYNAVIASYECGLNSQQIGATHTSVTIGPYNPSDLSTMNVCNKFSFQSLDYSQLSLFTTSLSYSCTSTDSNNIYYAGVAFVSQGSAIAFPYLRPPDAITMIDSLWKHCSVLRESVEYDPPIALSTVLDLGPGTMGSFLPSPSAQPGSIFTPSYATKTVQDHAAPVQRILGPPSVPAKTLGAVASRPTETEIPGSSIVPPQELISQSINPIILEEPDNSETKDIGILDNQKFPSAVELSAEGQALPRVVPMTVERATGSWPNPIILISGSRVPNENKDIIIESSTIVGEDFNVSLEPEASSEMDDPEGSNGPPSDSFAIAPVASIARSDDNFAFAPTATLSADTPRTINTHLPLIPITLASDYFLHEGSDGGLLLASATTATLSADTPRIISAHLPSIPITLASDSILHEGSDGGLVLASARMWPGFQTAYASHSLSVGSGFVVIDGTDYVLTPTSSPLSLETQAMEEASSGGLRLGSATVRPGFQATFGGYSFSLGSKTIAVEGALYTWLGRASLVPVDGDSGLESLGLVDPAGQDESLSQGQVSTVTASYINRFASTEGSLMLSAGAAMTGAKNEIDSLIESTFDNVTAPARTTTEKTGKGRVTQLSSAVRSSKAIPSKGGACRSKAVYLLPAFGFLVGICRTLVL